MKIIEKGKNGDIKELVKTFATCFHSVGELIGNFDMQLLKIIGLLEESENTNFRLRALSLKADEIDKHFQKLNQIYSDYSSGELHPLYSNEVIPNLYKSVVRRFSEVVETVKLYLHAQDRNEENNTIYFSLSDKIRSYVWEVCNWSFELHYTKKAPPERFSGVAIRIDRNGNIVKDSILKWGDNYKGLGKFLYGNDFEFKIEGYY